MLSREEVLKYLKEHGPAAEEEISQALGLSISTMRTRSFSEDTCSSIDRKSQKTSAISSRYAALSLESVQRRQRFCSTVERCRNF